MSARGDTIVVDTIGWKARAALGRARGEARVLARMSEATWLVADGEIVWLGRSGGALHPRAALAAGVDARLREPIDTANEIVHLDQRAAREWWPAAVTMDARAAASLVDGAMRLRRSLADVGAVDGLARLFVRDDRPIDSVLRNVLERAAPRASEVAAACETDRAADAVAPALALLGLGAGLTPSGDDFVGGVFFARSLLARAGGADAAGWRAAADAVRAQARERTHPISAALLGDLLDGDGYAHLHDLVAALVADADPVAPTQRLTRLGHSSGWDIVAGFLSGLR